MTKKEAIAIGIALMTLITIIITGRIMTKRAQEKNIGESEKKVKTNQTQTEKQEEYVKTMKDGSKLNKSEELNKTKKLDEIEIKNIQFRETGGITTLLADVENKTDKEIAEKRIQIEIIDKEGKIITTLRGRIDKIKAGGKVKLNISVTADVTNAYDIKIKNR